MLSGRIAHFRIVGEIGAGGMGVVYRAHDLKLERDVALKVLPADTLHDETARARMLREARLAATLNHPSICTVHEVGEHEGRIYIAMELVEGRPLSERIAERGPSAGLATESVLRYGAQLAGALAHAHERHVLHRDLKSSNVVVLPDGRVKVLDFGLARRLWEEPDQPLTQQVTLTAPGMVVGTPHYLAPEVLRGNKADERSDLWALGVLLHEMACGELPFGGQTSFELMAAILNDPPRALPNRIPAGLRAVIARCLAKEPGERYQRASEVQAALEAIQSGAQAEPPAPAGERWRPRVVPLAVAVGLVLVSGGGWLAWRSLAPTPTPVERQLTSNPIGLEVSGPIISPDGKSLVYCDKSGFYLKEIASGETRPVPSPWVGPDGRAVVLRTRLNLKGWAWFPDGSRLLVTTSAGGGATAGVWQVSLVGWTWRRLATEGRGDAEVSPDGARIAFTRGDTAIWVMNADGQDAHFLHTLSPGGLAAGLTWAPDGSQIAFLDYRPGPDPPWIEVLNLSSRQTVTIVKDSLLVQRRGFVLQPLWLPDGAILYGRSDSLMSRSMTLWQARVDPVSGRLRGRPTPYARSATPIIQISTSADGRRIVVLKSDYQMDVHVADLEAGATRLANARRLTLDDRDDFIADWSQDGQSILFHSDRRGAIDLFRQRLDRSMPDLVVSATHVWGNAAAESPDRAWVLFQQIPPSTDKNGPGRIMRAPISGGPAETVLAYTRFTTMGCSFRPDVSCLMCETDSTGSVFSILDPIHGRGHEVARLPKGGFSYNWAISIDGTRLAVSNFRGEDSVRVMSLGTARSRSIGLRFRSGFTPGGPLLNACFAGVAERDGLIAAAQDYLLHVDASGGAIPLYQGGTSVAVPRVSPDGRHVAWQQLNATQIAWLWERRR
jgi:eukaryotic-like serine/threonine-protein kinase